MLLLKRGNKTHFGISGFVCKNRASKTRDSVGLYISECFDYEVRNDLISSDVSLFEAVFIKILYSDCDNNLIVVVIYRLSVCDADEFSKTFEPILQNVNFENNFNW